MWNVSYAICNVRGVVCKVLGRLLPKSNFKSIALSKSSNLMQKTVLNNIFIIKNNKYLL